MANWMGWLIVAIVTFIVELMGPALISIWFSAAALIMAPISLLNPPMPLQVFLFAAISLVAMIVSKRIYTSKIKPQNPLKDNLEDKIINQTALVTKTIDNRKNEGQVLVSGVYWQAISKDGTIINKDENVKIEKIEDMKLIVTKNELKGE